MKSNVDWSMYDQQDTQESKNIKSTSSGSADWDMYDEIPELTKEERREKSAKEDVMLQKYLPKENPEQKFENMSIQEKMEYNQAMKTAREYQQSAGFTKNMLSGLTFGASEKIDFLKPKEHELNQIGGKLTGEAIKYTPLFRGLHALVGLGGFGAATEAGLTIAGAGGIGAGSETIKQAIKGEGFEPVEIAKEGALFALFESLMYTAPEAYIWLKSLRPSQRTKVLVEGVLPPDLPPNSMKLFDEEVVPAIRQKAEQMHKEAYEEAIETANKEYTDQVAKYESAKGEQKADLGYIKAQHENKMRQIEAENQRAIQEYQNDMAQFEEQSAKEQTIKESMKGPEGEGIDLKGRITKEAEDLGVGVPPPYKAKTPLQENVGKIFAEEAVPNETFGGAKLKKTLQDLDQAAYRKVNEAYDISKEANSQIETIHTNLAQDIQAELINLEKLPAPSAPTEKLKSSLSKLLKSLAEVKDGIITGYKPINNQVLLDQAKEFRHMVDFDFTHGTPTGIFKPWIKKVQEAAEQAAVHMGDKAAVEANQNARTMYKEWSETYNNDYIRPYRDTTNKSYSKLYKNAQDIDNFKQIENVLNQTPEGMQEANQLRRSLVENKLDPILNNPGKYTADQLNAELKELYPIINKEEAQQVRNTVNESQKTKPIIAKKEGRAEKPEEPKLKEGPIAIKIPKLKGKKPEKPEIKPSKSMQAASKLMDITPEKAMKMSDSVSGLRELKDNVPKPIYDKIAGDKLKRVLYHGKVRPKWTGSEIETVMNNADNYTIISEILGEDAASIMLDEAIKIGEKRITVDALKKLGMAPAKLKMLTMFGIF